MEAGGLNLYGFCRNNSTNLWDYLGMTPIFTAPTDHGDASDSKQIEYADEGGFWRVSWYCNGGTDWYAAETVFVLNAVTVTPGANDENVGPPIDVFGLFAGTGDDDFAPNNAATRTTQSGQAVVFVVDGAGLNVFDHTGVAVRGPDGKLRYYDVQAESKTNPKPGGSVNTYTLEAFKKTYGERHPRYTVVDVPNINGLTDFLQKSNEKWRNGGYGYDAEDRNCTAFVCDALARGRVNVPLIPGDRGEIPWVFPNDLEQALRHYGGKAVDGPN